MKLLLDQNLSYKVLDSLDSAFAGSIHVSKVGLERATDAEVWTYGQVNNLIIVTKDSDFLEKSLLLGAPPKVIWIRRGNCSTSEIIVLLNKNYEAISELSRSETSTLLTLF